MTLRNFGLSFSRRSARPDADIWWSAKAALTLAIIFAVLLVALFA